MNPVQTMFTELTRLEGLVRADADVIPRFTIFTPEKTYRLQVQFVPNQQEMTKRLSAVADFMRRKGATAFVLAYELSKPDLIAALVVSDIVDCLVKRVTRGQTNIIGDLEKWTNIGPEFLHLLRQPASGPVELGDWWHELP